jgi:hypothetical protein
MSWRDTITIHPAADIFPLLADDDVAAPALAGAPLGKQSVAVTMACRNIDPGRGSPVLHKPVQPDRALFSMTSETSVLAHIGHGRLWKHESGIPAR